MAICFGGCNNGYKLKIKIRQSLKSNISIKSTYFEYKTIGELQTDTVQNIVKIRIKNAKSKTQD
jgi:hypothetical protein